MTLEEKALEDYTEEEIREMFLDTFFWVAENRPDWLQEAIERKRKILLRLGRKAGQTDLGLYKEIL